jgi:class 3 adenylate cyclase/predicted ATPase
MSDTGEWLESFGLGQYAKTFEENAVDLDMIPKLTEDHLKDLGVGALGHRLRILEEAKSIPVSEPKVEAISRFVAQDSSTSEAERRQLTVMFCDLVGSTSLSEQMEIEEYREMLISYQSAAANAIRKYEGYIARYMGDGLLIYFGYPTAHEDDAERAVRTALNTVDAVSKLTAPSDGALQVRIGIATGLVVAGDIVGEGASEEKAVLGETPNLAARLQSIAEPNQVLIAENTRRLTGAAFDYVDLGSRDLKGLSAPQSVWAVIAAREVSSRFETTRPVELTSLVGRSEERELLSRRWVLAREGEGQVVLLSGEPGIGKSRLVQAFLLSTSADDPMVLRYQCSPHHVSSALYPFIQQLQYVAGFEHDDSPSVRLDKLERSLEVESRESTTSMALFANLLSIPFTEHFPVIDLSPEQVKQQTLEALLVELKIWCERQPVVLVFEDLHWIDPTSNELLSSIVEAARSQPLLVILTFRPEFVAPWVGESHVSLLAFNRLNRQMSFELVAAVSGGKPLPEELALQIVEKTDGVPLFIEELTQTILESGFVREEADVYILTGPLPSLAVPNTLQESLTARLDSLAGARKVAQTAAVLGREFSRAILTAIMRQSDEEVDNALARLLEAGLIFRSGPETLAFKHALVRDAAYETLLKSRRKALHSRIAETLENEFPESTATEPELLAYHYSEADLVGPSLKYWRQAGKRAVEQCTYAEAISHLEHGLKLVEQHPDEDVAARSEIELRILLGVPLMSREGWASDVVEENYRRAVTLCEKIGESEQLFPAVWGLWIGQMMRSKARDACVLADRLLEVGRQQNDPGLQLQAHHSQWTSRILLGQLSATLEHTGRGIELYNADDHHALTYTYGGHDAGVCARQISSLALWLCGYPEQAKERLAMGFELASELGHLNTLVEVMGVGMILAATQRDASMVAEWTKKMIELTPEGEYEAYKLWGNGALGWTKVLQGEHKEGFAAMRGALESWLKDGVAWTAPMLMLAVTEIGSRESADEGIGIAKRVLELAKRDDVPWFQADILRVTGELLYLRTPDDFEESVLPLQQALVVAQEQGARSLELRAAMGLARVWYERGKRTEARELLVPIYDWFTEGFGTPDLIEAKALIGQIT